MTTAVALVSLDEHEVVHHGRERGVHTDGAARSWQRVGPSGYDALCLQDQDKLFSVYAGLRAIVPTKDADPSAAARGVVEAAVGDLALAQTAFDDWFALSIRSAT